MNVTVDWNKALPQILPQLKAFVSSKTEDPNAAEDVLQNTLLRAYENVGRLRDGKELLPWMYTLARFEVRKHFLYEKRRKKASGGPAFFPGAAEDGDDFSEFEESLERICATGAGLDALTSTALHLFSQYSRAEIAAYLCLDYSTVSKHIKRVKSRVNTGRAPDPTLVKSLKRKIVWMLFEIGLFPATGVLARNIELCRYSVVMMSEMAGQFKDDIMLFLQQMQCLYNLSQSAEYEHTEIPLLMFHQCRREYWDAKLKREAHWLYENKLADCEDHGIRMMARAYDRMFYPATHDAVDWKESLWACEECLRVWPRSRVYWWKASCLHALEGPAKAAHYLEKYRNNKFIGDDYLFYYKLGFYYFEAGRREQAKACFRRVLSYSLNDPLRKYVESMAGKCSKK